MPHISRRHAIDLPLPVAEALPLFTPRGEMRWIADWRPVFVHPADGETREGMVFRTGSGRGGDDLVLLEWAPEQHRIRYSRVTPASRVAHVSVTCTAIAAGRTQVEVRYDVTALNEAGSAFIATLTEEAFRAMIEGWKDLIDRHIIQQPSGGQ